MFVADFRPLAFTASMNSGKTIDGMIWAGWRTVRSSERRAITPTWVASDGPPPLVRAPIGRVVALIGRSPRSGAAQVLRSRSCRDGLRVGLGAAGAVGTAGGGPRLGPS